MKYLLLMFIVFWAEFTDAQNLNDLLGEWKGTLGQEEGGLRSEYDYKIVFSKAEEGKLVGKAYIAYKDDPSQNGTLEMEAVLNGDEVTIFDKKVVVNLDESVGYWCVKTMKMRLKEENGYYVLSGTWTAPSCSGGTIDVSKKIKARKNVNVAPVEEKEVARKIEIKDKVHSTNRTVVIHIWDGNQEDGDILSLQLNGEWILKEHLLTNKKERLEVTLKTGENTLILHADNLGKIPPNTAAISIDDGTRVRKLVLSSDKMKSEALKIYVK